MANRKWKDCINCRMTLELTKTLIEILREALDLDQESDCISYAFADINCSLCVKLSMVRSSFSTLLIILITCRVLYLLFTFVLTCESVCL